MYEQIELLPVHEPVCTVSETSYVPVAQTTENDLENVTRFVFEAVTERVDGCDGSWALFEKPCLNSQNVRLPQHSSPNC